MIGWESIAYAVTRGAVRAYLDVLRETAEAIQESPTDADRALADRCRAALQRLHLDPAPAGAGGSQRPAPPLTPGSGVGVAPSA